MSIRTNPMKAVAVLLKRVRSARRIFQERAKDESFDGKLETLTRELKKINDLFMRVKKNEDALLDILTEVDGHLRKLDKKRLDDDMHAICNRIRDSSHKLLPMDAFESYEEDNNTTHHPSSSTQPNNHLLLPPHLNLSPDMLEGQLRSFLWCLSIFPEDAVIKKGRIIYWWIGLGLFSKEEKTAEEAGDDVINKLLELNVIVPYGSPKCPLVNKFQIHPHFRRRLHVQRINILHLGSLIPGLPGDTFLVLEKHKLILGDPNLPIRIPWRLIETIFNVGTSYLNFGSQWLDTEHLQVLQLGRWLDSPKHHIEVGSQEFLNELINLKRLKYLSLRGISRISELPPSIAQHDILQILDLKACHNLETLPNDIGSMTSLTHLILSQCYLLEAMPKGIDNLTQLQVLKGYVIGSFRKTPCRISDFTNLKNLRRLSIHIGSEAVIKDREFESLGELLALKHLKISWGVSDTRYSDIQIILPSSLKKLHLECFPRQKIPEWLKPSKAPQGLIELKITGGKLESMNHEEDKNEWSIRIVHLKYLRHLKVDLTNLHDLFPLLRYVEIKKISNNSYSEWSID